MEATVPKAKFDALQAAFEALQADHNKIKHEFEQLKRLVFGATSERFVPTETPEQLALFDQAPVDKEEVDKEDITYQRRKGTGKKAHPGRAPLPDHLPIERKVIEPDENTDGMVRIGEEITRKVDYTPGTLRILEYVRPKYAPAKSDQVDNETCPILIADVPDQVLPKAIAGAGLIAQVIVSKYIDHLPLNRQRDIFTRDHGWTIPPSTLNGWFKGACQVIAPLYGVLEHDVFTTDYLQGDESRIIVLEIGKEKTKNKSHRYPGKVRKVHLGYMWVFRNPLTGNVFFTYRKGRGANVLHETLGDYEGYLQSDGYSAYSSYMKKHAGVTLISCLAHIRRKFFDAQSNHRELAELALKAIQGLYRVEATCRKYEVSHERRRYLRERHARPIYEALLEWVDYNQRNNLTKGAIGTALTYAKNHLPRLAPYLEDGRIEIDNNQIENKIRPLALGRKNYLFAGSNAGAQRAAMMYSFFASCKAHGVNPRHWLEDVLLRIGRHKPSKYWELLPGNWKPLENKAAREMAMAEV